jgi:hypothetical protein
MERLISTFCLRQTCAPIFVIPSDCRLRAIGSWGISFREKLLKPTGFAVGIQEIAIVRRVKVGSESRHPIGFALADWHSDVDGKK